MERETLEQLGAFTKTDFRLWLEKRMHEQWSDDERIRYYAFDFRHLDIPFSESHLECLGKLFAKLDSPAQESLREALYSILSDTKLDALPKQTMKDLIFLVFQFNEKQILPDQARTLLMTVIPDGPWGQKYPSLIYQCASVMLYFDPTVETLLLEKFIKAGKALKIPEVA